MKSNDKVQIKIINNNIYKFIKLLSRKEIEIFNVENKEDYFYIIISINDLNKLKKLLKKKDYEIIKYIGVNGYINFIKKHYLFITALLFGITILFTLSNIIFKIEVNTNNEKVKKIILDELSKYGIEEYKFFKSYKYLEDTKNKIMNENKDILEWMSIERDGVTYTINLTLRVGENEEKIYPISDIVAKKDGIIKHIESSSGVIVKELNDYVKKGETIISGNIIKSDKYLKGQVASIGKVFAEVWYTVDVSMPFEYVEYEKTDKSYNEYYIKIFNKKLTLINKYNLKNIMFKESVYINKVYLPFKIYKAQTNVYEYKKYKLTKEEAYNMALEKAINKIKTNLKESEYIIDKKVLKKTTTSSKIELRVFFKVYENITSRKEIEEIEIGTDMTKKGS